MICQLDYCIYNKDFVCILNEIQLNSFGMCDNCTIVSIPDKLFKSLKDKQLEKIENRWKYEKNN